MDQQFNFLSKKQETIIDIDGEVILYREVFEHHINLMDNLIQELPWRRDKITLYGKTHPVPRLQVWMADDGLSYTYSGIKMEPIPFQETVNEIKIKVEEITNAKFNSCLINYYRTGDDYAAWHADNEKGVGPFIASVSLGETRIFKLKHRTLELKESLELNGGEVLLMKAPLQEHWLHQLNKTKKKVGPRVNLTFRQLRADIC